MPRIGLSKKRKLPALRLLGGTFSPLQYVKFFPKTFGWRLLREERDIYTLLHKEQILSLEKKHSFLALDEWSFWERCYLPSFPLKGKTVLDVGAGCGETAHFYLLHGASKIIAIESDFAAIKLLCENVKINNWPVEVVHSYFDLAFMNLLFDFMKMDCEGCEKELLKLSTSHLPPSVIEVHDEETRERFETKFGLELVERLTDTVSVLRKKDKT